MPLRSLALTHLVAILNLLPLCSALHAQELRQELDAGMHHLRQGEPREWAAFPEQPDAGQYALDFDSPANAQEWTLQLRQQDVKQSWTIRLNDQEVGKLHRDENDMRVCFPLKAGMLKDGKNRLTIEQDPGRRSSPDDIRLGQIVLHRQPKHDVLRQAHIEVRVLDSDTQRPTPARITIVDADGCLCESHVEQTPQVAVRPGTIFTATGRARLGLPPGEYRILAGRGFEYSLAEVTLTLKAGASESRQLQIRREVPTQGYVACDTHIHTLTYSGHGDATIQERMVTIAAEGIELPIAADHNVHIDFAPVAREVGVEEYFTPVIGNEVTTPVGHFNIFPVAADAAVPNHQLRHWGEIFAEIERATAAPIVILNHARDLHSGVRPFGPDHFNDAVAENLDAWPLQMIAMEVVNSGATQTDFMQLFHDWMSLLNRGLPITPVGSSDSHDVARHFVGQGRTYIRCDDRNPGEIPVADAVEAFQKGQVLVSYGLLVKMEVDGRSSGELVPGTDQPLQVKLQVLGPHWVAADRIDLYANGELIRTEPIAAADATAEPGVKWKGAWTVDPRLHDVHLVAIASGPGLDAPWWKAAKPYQPVSPHWEPRFFGCSGATWVDFDGDGKPTSAREYAQRLWDRAGRGLPALLQHLADYDPSVAAHAAHLYHTAGGSLTDADVQQQLRTAAEPARTGFDRYHQAWRETQAAKASPGN
jgi:hypothetical protein